MLADNQTLPNVDRILYVTEGSTFGIREPVRSYRRQRLDVDPAPTACPTPHIQISNGGEISAPSNGDLVF